MIVTRDNHGNVVGSINTVNTPNGMVTTNTIFREGDAVAQHISSYDHNSGQVSNADLFGSLVK